MILLDLSLFIQVIWRIYAGPCATFLALCNCLLASDNRFFTERNSQKPENPNPFKETFYSSFFLSNLTGLLFLTWKQKSNRLFPKLKNCPKIISEMSGINSKSTVSNWIWFDLSATRNRLPSIVTISSNLT